MATIRNPIKKAIELSDALNAAAPQASLDLEDVTAELKDVRRLWGTLLPVEKKSTDALALGARKRELNAWVRMLRTGVNPKDYPPFDPECLTWRDARGYPRLAVFSLDDARFELSILSRWSGYSQDFWPWPLPKVIKRCYKDVFDLLRGMAKEERKSMRLRTTFDGLIPAEVKDEIKVADKQFQSLFLVAEVDKWELKKSAPIRRNVDPLLIGYQADRLWLVAAFDTTTLEKYIEAYAVSQA